MPRQNLLMQAKPELHDRFQTNRDHNNSASQQSSSLSIAEERHERPIKSKGFAKLVTNRQSTGHKTFASQSKHTKENKNATPFPSTINISHRLENESDVIVFPEKIDSNANVAHRKRSLPPPGLAAKPLHSSI